MMKFLLVVLAIHFVGELIGNRRKDKRSNKAELMNKTVRHPAENEL